VGGGGEVDSEAPRRLAQVPKHPFYKDLGLFRVSFYKDLGLAQVPVPPVYMLFIGIKYAVSKCNAPVYT